MPNGGHHPQRARGRLLGEMHLTMAGTQYYDAEVESRDPVFFERERDSPYDVNSIRIDNEHGETVGHIPRRIARWMAPLIDSGQMRIEGYVPPQYDGSGESIPVALAIFLTHRGEHIFHPNLQSMEEGEIFHNLMIAAWQQSGAYPSPRHLAPIVKKFLTLLDRNTLPKTHLIFSLMRARSEGRSVPDGRTPVTPPHRPGHHRSAASDNQPFPRGKEIVESLKIGPARHFHNLTLFPLFSDRIRKVDYILLGTAIKERLAEVTEISEGGSVPTLRVNNHSDRPILIPEGEILVGGKQNRTVNVTVIVQPHSIFDVPVSCVERGRWRHDSSVFEAECSAPPIMRAHKMASVHRNRREHGSSHSDQGRVWEVCEEILCDAEAMSPTDSVIESFAARKNHIDRYREELKLPENAQGFVMACDQKILGMDLFDSNDTLAQQWERISEAYFLQASCSGAIREQTAEASVSNFLKEVAEHMTLAAHPVTQNQEVEIESDKVVGSGIFFEDDLCHVSAFEQQPAY